MNNQASELTILTSFTAEKIATLRRESRFFWLDLVNPSADELHALGDSLSLHSLSIEDSLTFGQRPKLDDYEQYAMFVLYGAAQTDDDHDIDLLEIHAYVHGDYVMTVRRSPCAAIDHLHQVLGKGVSLPESGVIYRIVDALVDTFFPLLAQIDDRIDELEDAIIAGATQEDLQTLFMLKRRLVHLRKVVTPQRDLLARATDRLADVPGLEAGSRDYFRDVYDHMIRISDMVDTYRDLLTGAMDVYLSSIANRQNDVMKQLSVVATIFLPLTFITGFFGQNFLWMTDRISSAMAFLCLGIGGILVSSVLLILLFKKLRWF